MDKFQSYFVNVIFDRANPRKQGGGESVDKFILDLHRVAEHGSHGTLNDKMIQDHIVEGLCDTVFSEKLQMDAKLTLDKAVRAARETESVRSFER